MRSLLVLALLAGCTRTETVVAEVTPAPTSSARPPPTVEPTPDPVTPEAIVFARSSEEAPPLGAACPSASICGSRNRVALRAFEDRRFSGVRDPAPCTRVDLSGESMGPQVKSACVAGDRFFFQASCVMCRMPYASIIEGVVSEMTPSQRAFVQKLTSLEVASLTTADAWDRAIREAAQRKPKN
jgi:hypothetical protein